MDVDRMVDSEHLVRIQNQRGRPQNDYNWPKPMAVGTSGVADMVAHDSQ